MFKWAEELVKLWRRWRLDERASFRWGNAWLERCLGPAAPGDLVVVAGRTNVGKSHYVLGEVALPMAAANERPVVYCSLEDPPHRVGRRLEVYGATASKLLCAFPERNLLSEVLALIEEAGKQGAVAVVVDYLQNVSFDSDVVVFSEAGAISRTVTELKLAARRAGLVLVLVSQLRRPAATWGAGERPPFPTMYELKGSGDIENKSEFILLLGQGRDPKHVLVELGKAKDAAVGARRRLQRGEGGRLEPYHEEVQDELDA